ncbi:SDR family NAD(P)-dependent oxidoreductase [Kyrpidia tusciae]|uniref:Short-chain dehydrogenase/reductase SDR n=1 Tax=Kyrpidia tusciae (strain DSM 2912 / NBRC 15312 / T2) TaxID=562970 RepID=D5WXV7_KYRT2|nr:glucose 1-dehydrogenase [Kyrpidia tusciae]ADG06016.1 short-chain dehydrogenase/reductase SDR [Kyrpidia tusciae DSM 2912]
MERVKGKVAIVTGAARGQGAAEARLLAKEGAKVCLTDVLVDEGRTVAEELQKEGYDTVFERLDVTDPKAWQTVVEGVIQRYGKIDILVNNAGILAMEGVEDTTLEIWNRVLSVNLTGVFLGMKTVLPYMKQQRSGSIINTSSIYGLIGSGGAAAYQATKGAVRILTKTAAVEYAPYWIRINSVHPGVIDTPMIAGIKEAGALEQVNALTALPRLGTPEDIAFGVLYLASDESSFVTGSELVIDGGYTTR